MDNLLPTLNAWQPRILSVLRIMAALLLLQHGLVKILSFPTAFPMPVGLFSRYWFAGVIEIIGGLLLLAGFYTRYVAFVLAGLMAFAYFLGHAGRSFFPIMNGGSLAILYCFTFLYLVFAGPGPWSVDAQRSNTY
ncbi:DoxX family protein [Phreatobacter aquaticus]|uniref:DoxX family protein n=1 Tax=Phreatobacter aquaticus TaxID=2570229 RepID=A0A4D7QH55_9HYPH|nr:DoxX family protein [Phreatobacter aquaticus]QCK84784.1 DoxX family protein [Phreatobacter aquaticus]